MKNTDHVLLFCGKFNGEVELDEYLSMNYDDDDNYHSQFMKDFNIDWYDEDFSERSFINSADLENHIKQHSYGESFHTHLFKDLKNHQDFNVLYFIYDYQAYFNLADIKPSKEAKMKLVGSYEYQKIF